MSEQDTPDMVPSRVSVAADAITRVGAGTPFASLVVLILCLILIGFFWFVQASNSAFEERAFSQLTEARQERSKTQDENRQIIEDLLGFCSAQMDAQRRFMERLDPDLLQDP